MHRKLGLIIALIVVLGGYLVFFRQDSQVGAPNGKVKNVKQPAADSSIQKYTIDNQDSLYFVVNKQRGLPSSFVPENLVSMGNEQLRSDAANAVRQLIDAAKADGINLKIISGYRSYANQGSVYGGYVKKDGTAKADTYSARPGHSEHQLGLAADLGTGVCDLQICFESTNAGKWLLNNSSRYGFIIRYPKGKENLTGYQYEPWHIRYLGINLAEKVSKSGKTLEQFFGLPPALAY